MASEPQLQPPDARNQIFDEDHATSNGTHNMKGSL